MQVRSDPKLDFEEYFDNFTAMNVQNFIDYDCYSYLGLIHATMKAKRENLTKNV